MWFTDWRGDDERLLVGGPSIGDLLAWLAREGVEVRGLVWRSNGERVSSPISGRSNELLGRQINEAGGDVLLDQRVRLLADAVARAFDTDVDGPVIDAVERVAADRGVPMALVALEWVLSKPVVNSPIVGPAKPHHLADAAAAVDLRLTDEEVRVLGEPYVPQAAFWC